MEKLELPEGLETIGAQAFYSQDALEELIIPDTVTSIGDRCFQNATGLKKVKLPEGLTEISMFFYGCSKLEEVELPDSLADIIGYTTTDDGQDRGSFYGTKNLKKLVFGKNLATIDKATFEGCGIADGGKIYYKGNAEDWGLVMIDPSNNSALAGAGIYFYSEAQPTTEGKFWHYDADSKIAEWEPYVAPGTDADTPNTGDNSGSSEQAPGSSEQAPGTGDNSGSSEERPGSSEERPGSSEERPGSSDSADNA